MKKLCYIVVLTCVLVGCGGRGAQIPSQRKGQAPKEDSTALALMELNLQLAKAADDQLTQLATAQQESYALYDAHAWMHILSRGNEDLPAPEHEGTCTLHMRVYTLGGKLLWDTEGTFRLGKNELPMAVEWNMDELHPGGMARMYAPWYTAFGQQGTAHVPPYENVMIEIELR